MAQKTIAFTPTGWAVRTEPGTRMSWSPTIGGASMLAAHDSDLAVCTNSTGVAIDSHSLDAKTFKETASLPTFEADARNPSLKIRCYMQTTDSKPANPFIYVFDSSDMGNNEAMGPFDTVQAGQFYERISSWPSMAGNDVFASLAGGRFCVSCIFPSRPADGGSSNFRWDAVEAVLTYTYGPNTTPNPFNFTDKAGAVGTQVLSNVVNITGIDVPQLVSIAGDASAVFSVNGDAFSNVARNIANGQTLQLRMTAPGVVGNAVNCTVTVETRSDAWKVTAGSDVPSTTLGAPADLVGCIPGWLVPDGTVVTGQTFRYAPRGNTIPMPFSFEWGNGVTGVQYSTTAATGPWTDGAVPGSCPVNGTIFIRCYAPLGFAAVGFVRLHYTAGDLTDDTTVTTGAVGTIYKLDLSPIDAFEALVASSVKHWTPTPAGAAHHVSVATQSSVDSNPGATVSTYADVGRWWRRADTSVVPWPVGAKLKGIDYGGNRNQQSPQGAVVSNFFGRNPADTAWVQWAGADSALSSAIVFLNGGASPGVTPTGWTLDQLFAAIQNDTLQIGRRTTLQDPLASGASISLRTHVLRVFFEVTQPPYGQTWEI